MKYMVIGRAEADVIKGFLPDEAYEELLSSEKRYALCAVDSDDRLCGAGTFDADKAAEIQEILVTVDHEGKLERFILERIVSVCEQLGCKGIGMDIYDEDDPAFYDKLLTGMGFIHSGLATVYRFMLSEVERCPLLKDIEPGKNIISLEEASEQQKKVFSNILKKNRVYDHFLNGDFDPSLSAVIIKDNAIDGCLLVSDSETEEGFEISFMYTQNPDDYMNTAQMMSYVKERLRGAFPEDVPGFVIATNENSDKIIRKLLPDAEIRDHCNTYILTL